MNLNKSNQGWLKFISIVFESSEELFFRSQNVLEMTEQISIKPTQFSKAWHQVNKIGHSIFQRKVWSELMPECQQMVGKEHAVVVLDSG